MYGAENKIVDPDRAVIQPLHYESLIKKQVSAAVLRLDMIHPVISGNKWFKLKLYLKDAMAGGYETILTFGGAFSNHIIATACLAAQSGLRSIGIIRGEKSSTLSHTLIDAQAFGMDLHFMSRGTYREKSGPDFMRFIGDRFGRVYVVPEGGAGKLGVNGSAEILQPHDLTDYSYVMAAMGTGTMFSGLLQEARPEITVIGIPVLKAPLSYWETQIQLHVNVPEKKNWKIFDNYHFGGYAKKNASLLQFMNHWFETTGIPSDFVYTGKLFYAFEELLRKDEFTAGSRVLLIHSGGLQGNLSLPQGSLIF